MRSTISRIARRAVQPEVKYVGENLIDSSFNPSITSGDVYPALPAVTQGDGDFQRVGDKIKGRYLYLRGHVTYDTVTVAGTGSLWDNHPIVVRLLCLSQKNVKSTNLLSNIRTENLLDDRIGTDATRSFTGANMYDITAPINKDLFTVHYDRKIYMSPQGLAGAGSGSIAWTGGQRAVPFTAKIKVPSTMTFDDSALGAGMCTNFAPFFVAGWCYADGSAAPSGTTTPIHINMQSRVYFTDV